MTYLLLDADDGAGGLGVNRHLRAADFGALVLALRQTHVHFLLSPRVGGNGIQFDARRQTHVHFLLFTGRSRGNEGSFCSTVERAHTNDVLKRPQVARELLLDVGPDGRGHLDFVALDDLYNKRDQGTSELLLCFPRRDPDQR